MPYPRKHHYLPEWYLSRWKQPSNGNEVLWEFSRVGPRKKLRARHCHPSGTGYERDLYTKPNLAGEEATEIETKLLQIIDDRGAKAMSMAERNEAAGPQDKADLVQFMLSMLHRSPERIDYLEQRFAQYLADNPLFDDKDRAVFRTGALNIFVELVQSQPMIDRMMHMQIFVINLGDEAHELLTSDNPLMVSNGIAHKDAFVMLPTGPRTLIMLANNKALPDHVAGHGGKVISKAMNDAVTIQAKKLVFGPNKKQMGFIDNRLNRLNLHLADEVDPVTGLVKWKI